MIGALLKSLATMILTLGLLVSMAQAQEECPYKGRKLGPEELTSILSDHRQWVRRWQTAHFSKEWVAQNPLGRANLCLADLREAELNEANLVGAKLNKANLVGAKLNKADLLRAELNEAHLVGAKLNEAHLVGAKLNKADLREAELNEADLFRAELNEADLVGAKLNKADLSEATIKDARLASTNLTAAIYAPAPLSPSPDVAGIVGLHALNFPKNGEIGLVQLREILQKAGLREAERQATFSIEWGKTQHLLEDWMSHPGEGIEGLFRLIAFEWTTNYGLSYGRALIWLFVVWLLLVPVYWWMIWRGSGPLIPIYYWSIWRRSARLNGLAGIHRVWPKDRVEVREGIPTLEGTARVERLRAAGWAAFGWSVWFSLLSAFHIGFREFSVGTWLSRLHPRQFTLEATGWVRTVSGLQSLLSLYLLAMWVLTYFGRPFQ